MEIFYILGPCFAIFINTFVFPLGVQYRMPGTIELVSGCCLQIYFQDVHKWIFS